MVASRQVEIPYYRAVRRQRGRGFGALAPVIGRNAVPFLRKNVVPAAECVGADLLEFVAPEIGEVISGRKSFKLAAKSVGKQTLKKPLRGGGKQRRPEQEIYPTTSLDENCIEFEFQTDRSYYVDLRQSFLSLKLKFVKGRGYDTYESTEKKKEHKGESVVFTDIGNHEEEQKEVARVTYVNNMMHSIFSNNEVYINNQLIYNSNGLYAHKSYILMNFRAAISENKEFLHCEGYDYEQDPEDISNPYLILLLHGE